MLGNVGTYEKIGYTAVGTTVNFAARLQTAAQPGTPCVSDATWALVSSEYVCTPQSPRIEKLKGLEDQRLWDIAQKRAR